MNLLVFRMKHRGPSRSELSHALGGDSVEIELRLGVGRVGGERVDVLTADLNEGGRALRLNCRLLSCELRKRDVERAVQTERLVFAVPDVASLQRPRRFQLTGVSRDCRVDDCRTLEGASDCFGETVQ